MKMNYKLINKETGESHICFKVTNMGIDKYLTVEDYDKPLPDNYNGKRLIATSIKSSDIPTVIDDGKAIAEEYSLNIDSWSNLEHKRENKNHFLNGYEQSQKTHPFTEDDMIEFAEWREKHLIQLNEWKANGLKCGDNYFSTKEILETWKQQNPKILYYETTKKED